MKRFYKEISLGSEEGNRFSILLDGKPVKTPSGKVLSTPNKVIAEVMSEEWGAQKETINPQTMPVTQMVTTHLDHVSLYRSDIERQILNYLDTDMLCYRAEDTGVTSAMAKRQAGKWDKWVGWFNGKSATILKTTTELNAIKQDDIAHEYAKARVTAMDDFEFTLLQILTAETGSFILALAYLDEDMSPRDMLETANVEDFLKSEIYNTDFYGQDPHLEKQWAQDERIYTACRLCSDAIKAA